MTLTEFLLARIAEDETGARKAFDFHGDKNHGSRHYGAGFDYDCLECTMDAPFRPSRVLAECKAKRQIVEQHLWLYNDLNAGPTCFTCWHRNGLEGPGVWPCPTLRALAAVYADHDGYQEEWR